MNKKLLEMTITELWQLFPIFLTSHQDCWFLWYQEEQMHLKNILSRDAPLRIEHIGSTAIRGIWAKPIIDILIEIPPSKDINIYRETLLGHGYLCMSQTQKRLSLNKGYTENGFAPRVFHLHIRYAGDHDELYFRDYLNDHPDIAKEYEALKLSLWKKFDHDRDGYTAAKTDFVKKYTEIAKKHYKTIYQ